MAVDNPTEPDAGAHTSEWVEYHRRRLAAAHLDLDDCRARGDVEGEATARDTANRAIAALERLGIVGL